MDRALSELADLAEAEIDELRARGIEPTPAEIVKLNWLCWQVSAPGARLSLARGTPVFVGGVALWPLTLYASEWFERVGCSLPERWQEAALGYAMAFGYTDGAELNCGAAEAVKRVKTWYRSLRCTPGQYAEALRQVVNQGASDELPPPIEKSNTHYDAMTPGDMSAFLAASCGGDPVIWERRCSTSYALGLLKSVAAQAQADKKSMSSSIKRDAELALGWAIEQIIQSRKEAPNGKND